MKIKDPDVVYTVFLLLLLSIFILLNLFEAPRVALYYTNLAGLVSFLILSIWSLFLGLREERLRLKVYYIVQFVLGALIALYSTFLIVKFLGWL